MMIDPAKKAAGEAALRYVEPGMRLGLGTGTTIDYFLDALAAAEIDISGVPTSEATARRCLELGIRLLDPADVDHLHLCIDGADELDRQLNLTKGGGGAHLREKVVATMADEMVVVATPDKVVDRLADTFPLPVEVVSFAVSPVTHRLEGLGFHVKLRDEGRFVTDNGHVVLDCRMPGGIEDPAVMDVTLALIPGVADSGLFVDIAHRALLGKPDGTVKILDASDDQSDAST